MMIQSHASAPTLHATADHGLDDAATLPRIAVAPVAAPEVVLLRERAAATLEGLRAGAAIFQLSLVHFVISLVRD
jgi:hypothetical protein